MEEKKGLKVWSKKCAEQNNYEEKLINFCFLIFDEFKNRVLFFCFELKKFKNIFIYDISITIPVFIGFREQLLKMITLANNAHNTYPKSETLPKSGLAWTTNMTICKGWRLAWSRRSAHWGSHIFWIRSSLPYLFLGAQTKPIPRIWRYLWSLW